MLCGSKSVIMLMSNRNFIILIIRRSFPVFNSVARFIFFHSPFFRLAIRLVFILTFSHGSNSAGAAVLSNVTVIRREFVATDVARPNYNFDVAILLTSL